MRKPFFIPPPANAEELELEPLVLHFLRGTLESLKKDLLKKKKKFSPQLNGPEVAFDICIAALTSAIKTIHFEQPEPKTVPD